MLYNWSAYRDNVRTEQQNKVKACRINSQSISSTLQCGKTQDTKRSSSRQSSIPIKCYFSVAVWYWKAKYFWRPSLLWLMWKKNERDVRANFAVLLLREFVLFQILRFLGLMLVFDFYHSNFWTQRINLIVSISQSQSYNIFKISF